MTRFADLSPADQRLIRSGRVTVPAPRDRPKRARRRDPRRVPTEPMYRCGRCKAEFPTIGDAERHQDEEHRGNGRIEFMGI